MMCMTRSLPLVLGGLAATSLVLSACGGGGTAEPSDTAAAAAAVEPAGTGGSASAEASAPADGSTEAAATAATEEPALTVTAAFYPLQHLAEQVGGERVEVTALTPPGAEAHDLELTPQSLAGLTQTGLVVYLADFQPAVDDALAGIEAPTIDLSPVADREIGETDDHGHDDEDDDHGHEDDDHGHGSTDPHFWTDPTRMAEAAALLADELSAVDPDGAETYAANLETFRADMADLDAQAQAALADCQVDVLVTAHDAFGYFADRYGFETRSINGLTPDQEPDARSLGEIADFVGEAGVTTVYTETLVSSAFADTVAAEAGVETAVLDPVEGITDASAAQDYRGVMEANIEAVRAGQACA
jgi:zinc transport system substrate-binding protein